MVGIVNKVNLESKWWNQEHCSKAAEGLHDPDLRGLNGVRNLTLAINSNWLKPFLVSLLRLAELYIYIFKL